jgi:hypothetical protein
VIVASMGDYYQLLREPGRGAVRVVNTAMRPGLRFIGAAHSCRHAARLAGRLVWSVPVRLARHGRARRGLAGSLARGRFALCLRVLPERRLTPALECVADRMRAWRR